MIGERIKKIRTDNNLTQEEFGQIFGVKRSAVSAWENNTTKPDADQIKLMAETFNQSSDYILGINRHEELKELLHEKGYMTGNDLSLNELIKLIRIVESMNKEEIIEVSEKDEN